ncbi:DgyrCDS11316 [Dimorphilus gyrociliatus]|uniref:DgyrCDS11316 n=1 Tax=Dimorphilus gyrociliatus TaxID=2664684 RepID=A0A7I8W3Y6_9ANNE|nr:DgyrCDS11316 [Dimorphilus gyrociliatus]
MKISKLLLLLSTIVLLSQVHSDPTGERCEECTVQDCLYGIHPDAETPGICDCRCKDCSDHCENCKYGVLNLKSDGCPDCSSCCDNPCDRNPCSGHKSVCVVNKYPNPFQVICRYGYTCVEPEHPVFDCKDVKCPDGQTCIEGSLKNSIPAKCVCPPVCQIFCEYGKVTDKNGCPTCTCNPPPPSTCNKNSDCPTNQVCDVTTKMCGCPDVMCTMFCENGFEQLNGCNICKCRESMSCSEKRCGPGEICVEDNIQCETAPCNRNPQCKKSETCSKKSDCPTNQVCDEETKTCGCAKYMCEMFCEDGFEQLNGCPICKCRKSESCLDKRCGPGETCIEDDIQCVTAPCYKNPRCVKSETCSKDFDCLENQVCDAATRTCLIFCPKLMCATFCEDGYEQVNGCNTCQCTKKLQRNHIIAIAITVTILILVAVVISVFTCHYMKKRATVRQSDNHQDAGNKQIKEGISPPPYYIHPSDEKGKPEQYDTIEVLPSTPPPQYTSVAF